MKNDQQEFPYGFHPQLVLRTPRYAFHSDYQAEDVKSFLNDSSFLEAIYLASPVLYRECLKLKNEEIKDKKDRDRIINSLIKYLGRMSSRSTPFGLFSGCSLVNWGEKTQVTFNQDTFNRHTRLDMHYLCALAQKFAGHPSIKPWLNYFPNTSVYTISDEMRYVEYRYVNGKRAHQISAVAKSSYLTAIVALTAEGKMLNDIASSIVDEDVSFEQANAFIEELIDVQLLVSELEPAVTGEEFIYQILSTLKRVQLQSPSDYVAQAIALLTEIESRLQALDTNRSNPHIAYQDIIKLILVLEVPFEENKLFQTDLSRKPVEGVLNDTLQQSLAESVTLLNSLYKDTKQDNLTSFARRYYERYEDKVMPLLDVLDTETGLGYLENSGQHISPLAEGIVLPGRRGADNYSIPFNSTSRMLFEKLKAATAANQYEVAFTAADFKDFSAEWSNTPPSISVMFKLVNEADHTILLENVGGSSAANLLGRFTHIGQEMHELVKDITGKEQETNPEIVFAEIIHLPESRIGNIMLHTVFRDYEIPYLGKSSLDHAHQLQTDDLMIAVRNNKIILYSKKLNKEIIPRLSTAHNFSYKSLPIYQFLCDLQTQGLRAGFKFGWGSISGQYKFLPRASYKNIILSPAQWQLNSEDLKPLLNSHEDQLEERIAAFRTKWAMPRYVALADGDNELLVDFSNILLVKSWLKTIEKRPTVLLKEFLNDTQSSISNENGQAYVNQFIASLVKEIPVYAVPLAQKIGLKAHTQVGRKFGPGSEWIYYKWYCGSTSADKLLEEAISPMVAELEEKGLIDKWFFIRYSDPHFHLRVRFHLREADRIGDCIQIITRYMAQQEHNGLIWKSQIDSYHREIERYGENSMVCAESLFHADSQVLLKFLSLTDGDEREDVRWIWGLRAVDSLLDDFALTLEDKGQLLHVIKEGFGKEFNMDKSLRVQINKKYADHRNTIALIMDRSGNPDNPYHSLIELTHCKSDLNRDFAQYITALNRDQELQVSLENLLGTYLHMMLNRLFIADARLHEMLVYDIMSRYYQSQIAQAKKNRSSEPIVEAL